MEMDDLTFLPSPLQREWQAAQAYLLKKTGEFDYKDKLKTLPEEEHKAYIDKSWKNIRYSKKAYDKLLTQHVNKKAESYPVGVEENLFENLLHEKSLNYDQLVSVKPATPVSEAEYDLIKHPKERMAQLSVSKRIGKQVENVEEAKIKEQIDALMASVKGLKVVA